MKISPPFRSFVLTGGVLAGVVVLIFVTVWLVFYFADERIRQQRQRITDRGVPITLAELQDFYPAVSLDRNAAPAYVNAERMLEKLDSHGRELKSLHATLQGISLEQIDPAITDQITEYLVKMAGVIATLDIAKQYSECRFSTDYTMGYVCEVPQAAYMGLFARLQSIRCIHAIMAGHPNEAIERIRDLGILVQHLRLDPNFLSQLQLSSIVAFAFKDTQLLVKSSVLSDDDLISLKTAFENLEVVDSFYPAFAGELCMAHSALTAFSEHCIDTKDENLNKEIAEYYGSISGLLLGPGLAKYQVFKILTPLESFSQTHAASWPDRLNWALAIDVSVKEWSSLSEPAKVVMPEFYGKTLAFIRNTAMTRLVLAAIAVERFRLKHDVMPQTMAALVPEFLQAPLVDPFDGKPIRFRQENNVGKVYSVFLNCRDDSAYNASADGEGEWNFKGDLVFETRN